jgi:hypothetical protein
MSPARARPKSGYRPHDSRGKRHSGVFLPIELERELIAIARLSEEQQAIEGHVEFFEIRIGSEQLVVTDDAFQRPDDRKAVFVIHAI